jgi:glycosyltransferase involved in cell wall biosynthesis
VTVATTDVFDDTSRLKKTREIFDGISVVRFRNVSNRLAKRCNGYLPLFFIPWFLRNHSKYDVVYCNDFFSVQTITVGITSKFRRFPILVQPHGSLSSVRRAAKFHRLKKLLVQLFDDILKNSHNIIALTEQEKKEIAALEPQLAAKIVVVPNGLELGEFADVEKIDLAARYNIPPGRNIIGFIGRLTYIKGIDISLEVLAKLKNRIDYSFLVIGPDEGERDRLEKQAIALGIADRVNFAGILGGQEKLSVIKSCDLFLFTSRDEGLPMTVLEVAALGVPQVISSECNVPELAEFEAGYVHPVGDIEGFANSIATILSNRAAALAMSRNARIMVEERFSSARILDRIDQLMMKSASE